MKSEGLIMAKLLSNGISSFYCSSLVHALHLIVCMSVYPWLSETRLSPLFFGCHLSIALVIPVFVFVALRRHLDRFCSATSSLLYSESIEFLDSL